MARSSQSSKKKETMTTPKGMRDLQGDTYLEYQGFFEKASETALYYGFTPIETPILEKIEVFTRSEGEGNELLDKEMYSLETKGGDRLALRPEGTAPIMRAYIEHGMHTEPQPVMLYHYGPYFRHENPQKKRYREFRQFGIEMIGTAKSVGDAVIIKTVLAILEDAGFKDAMVEINSIGDAECRPAFVDALTTYYKKHAKEVCASCADRIKTNPMRLLDCKEKSCADVQKGAPQPMGYLCSPCRQHFKEVLEYLETLEIPYVVNGHLVRGLDYYTKTVFEVFDTASAAPDAAAADETNDTSAEGEKAEDTAEDTEEAEVPEKLALASGGRYDYLARALGSRKDVSAVGAAIGVDRLLAQKARKNMSPRIVKKPKVYFIQIGFEAKLKSLAVIDILRKARIPITQALSKDGLSTQLAHAEKLGTPYTIIFGQKEAREDSVIVRNMENRSQDTVPINELAEYIKHIK